MPQPSQTASLKRLLTAPTRLFARSEVLQKPSPVPSANGCYAWYFREVPKTVPTRGCLTFEGKTLLCIGVAPDKQDKADSRQTLRSRIKRHYRGDAKGSTLRRTLGVLLEPQSGFPLRRVGSGNRITLTRAGEGYLNQWMEAGIASAAPAPSHEDSNECSILATLRGREGKDRAWGQGVWA